MKAFADSASTSRGPLDLGKNMLKSYFGQGAGIAGGSLDLDIHKAIMESFQNQKKDLLYLDINTLDRIIHLRSR